MLSAAAPTARIANSARTLKQSNQFISAHSLLTQTRAATKQRNKIIRTIRPNRSPNLVELLSRNHAQSPFLPTKYRSDHTNSIINPDKIRWRAPVIKAQARAILCKQAFHWRILQHIYQLNDQNQQSLSNKSTKNLLKQKPNFYDGSLTIPEFRQIKEDPVPKLIELFGGENRLSIKDKRLLGLYQPPKNITKPVTHHQVNDQEEEEEETMDKQPRYSRASIVPNSFGPYIGRRKPFKGKIRQRNREDKVAQVSAKMNKMDDRVHSYRKEWRIVKEKSKPSLPF
ncbi:hypothetical protein Pst134EA_025432 [Puccinia striiformis f. sp. tritici]|uniref:hypothetical protein n=1 Tax=Puccinia striiformis f. sp. tritici TaxID=168172 RepID=UPI002007925B|nr:hypothetical protein Pst134EA_025432 [Puccinia striiformis f. sp. tritici]KAH9451478.1 hypothetical protein Pst134EA_025432 [Puccinia striiformis f. sp. tritici]